MYSHERHVSHIVRFMRSYASSESASASASPPPPKKQIRFSAFVSTCANRARRTDDDIVLVDIYGCVCSKIGRTGIQAGRHAAAAEHGVETDKQGTFNAIRQIVYFFPNRRTHARTRGRKTNDTHHHQFAHVTGICNGDHSWDIGGARAHNS